MMEGNKVMMGGTPVPSTRENSAAKPRGYLRIDGTPERVYCRPV